MKVHRIIAHLFFSMLLFIFLVFFLGCDGGSSDSDSGNGTSDEQSSQVKSGALSPASVFESASDSATYCANAVFEASIQGGGGVTLVLTGTLTQTQPDSLNFTYSSDPNDKLVVIFADGRELTFEVTTFNGDFSIDADNFLYSPHQIDFTVAATGEFNLTITSTRVSTGYYTQSVSGTLDGTFVLDGVTYTADLTTAGDYYFETDSTGTEQQSTDTITGTITATDFTQTVNEILEFALVSTSGVVTTTSSRAMNNSWTAGNQQHELTNGLISRSFYNGTPNEVNSVWNATGQFLLDGVQIGELKLLPDSTGAFLEVRLTTDDGLSILIEKWHTQTSY